MKWVWLVFLGVLLPALILFSAGRILYRPGPPIAAQNALNDYIAQHSSAVQPLRVQSSVRAAHTQVFSAALSKASFGNGNYFSYFSDEGRRPPFPPTELWCVTLAGATAQTTVLVAQHEDMHVGAWLVHEPVDEAAVAALCP